MELLEKVYSVHGDSLPPGTSEYSAVVANLVSVLDIKKEYKTYDKFKLEYTKFCMNKRAEAAKLVVTKPLVPGGTKDAK